MTPRPYQKQFITATATAFHEGHRKVLGVLATGGGKTIVFAIIAARFLAKRNERTLILAHREELITQAVDKIEAATGLHAAIEKAEMRAPMDAPVVVASIQTMQGDRLKRWPADHFGLVVCDEAHHSISDQWQNTLKHFDSHARVLGVTATPDRGDKRALAAYYEHVSYECTILDLIRQGFLSPVMVRSVPLKIDIRNVKSTAGDFDAAGLGDALLPYLDQIAEYLAAHCKGRKILAFLPLISTSEKFVEACERAGISSRHVDGSSTHRSQTLAAFGAGEFSLLSNAMLLTEGYDEPSVDCVVVLRATKSRSLYCQMVGRGTRLAPGKENLLLLDFLWLHEKHNLAKAACLVSHCQKEQESIQKALEDGDKDLGEATDEAAMEREAALARQLAENQLKRERFMRLEDVAVVLRDTKLAEYEPTFRWETMPPTDGQRRTLEKFRVACPKTRGEAAALLDRMFNRSKEKLASVAQVALLTKLRHPNPHQATRDEAKTFIDGRFAKKA
jgi:superfamily II DNA or RNA helicase